MDKLEVGQELYYVPANRRYATPQVVTVEKIGRKWAQLSNRERIDIATRRADGGDYSSPGTCWSSKEEYELAVYTQKLWQAFTDGVKAKYCAPETIGVSEILQAAAVLKIDLSEVREHG